MRTSLVLMVAIAVVATYAPRVRAEDKTASGVVVSATGQPVEGAEVIVATPSRSAYPNLDKAKRDDWRSGAGTTLTDKQGHFTIKLPADAGLLSIHHAKVGYAEVKPQALEEQSTVKLDPWCRIEGVLRIGAKPAPAGTKVNLGSFGWGVDAARVHYNYGTTTDDGGHYVLDRVPAGVAPVTVRATKKSAYVEQYVGASPDKPVHFNIGGTGRTIVGKLVLTDGLDLKDLNDQKKKDRLYSTSVLRRDIPWPSDQEPRNQLSGEQREEATRAWRKTPEAIAAHKDEFRANLDFQPDGSFRVEDVPPGKYKLNLSIHRLGVVKGSDQAGKLMMDVTVPETPADPDGKPLDLGELKISGASTEGL